MQADLFAAPLLEGFERYDDFLTIAEEASLAVCIDAEPLEPFRFRQWTGRRLTRSFGWSYDFVSGRMARGDAMPDWLLPYRERAAAVAGLDPCAFEQALLIRYDPGAGIGWHRDRPAFDRVVGISLGVACEMRLRCRRAGGFDRRTVSLAPRAAYLLSGEARRDWEHSIAPLGETRRSITFRSLAARA